MKLKFAAALAALALSGTAMAANVDIELPDVLDSLDTGFQIPTRTVAAGESFTDTFKFVLGDNSDVYGSFTSAKAVLRGTVTKNVSFDSITLTGSSFAGIRANEDVSPAFLFSNLKEGTYVLKLTGHATGTLGGSYHGELLATAAVPEPEAVAMVLAGLAVVGGMVRRRKTV